MTKTLSLIAAGIAVAALATSSAFAAKVEKWDGSKNITIGGKSYTVSGSRTKVMINGKTASRDAIKVGMDCTAKGSGEASEIDCK
ncbi:MAG TPA: hypothetical protein VFA53_03605 [Xanthobacteraceae bacterium]|nr:hypothetical protein [Xanthobacteraceae bacterium]